MILRLKKARPWFYTRPLNGHFFRQVVNVYRLITRNTVEEKIMGLQKFKLKTANTVISKDNASLESMGKEQIFELFSLDAGSGKKAAKKESSGQFFNGS